MLFDSFTGKPAKNAANANRDLLLRNQNLGYGFLDEGYEEGIGYLQQGMQVGQDFLGRAATPLAALGGNYGQATGMLRNSLGLGGPEGTAAAQSAFQAGPGYKFALDQGLQGLARQRATQGRPGGGTISGAADADAMKYAMGLGNQEYGNWQKNLSQFINPELAATTGYAGVLGQGATLANAGNTNMANMAQTDAFGRVNLGNMTTQGMNQANTQEANAKMQASGNMWGAIGGGLSALTGAAGQAGGFKNLFG